jgi:hypothetical protein
MSDDITRDDLKKELEDLQGTPTVSVITDVVTITEDMVDDNGNTIEEKVPDPEPPDGYELGDMVPIQSPVVTCYELNLASQEY